MKRILQIAGALALLAWTVSGIVAWWVVKERVQIQIRDNGDDRAAAKETASLIADDLASVRHDLKGLAETTGRNLEALQANLTQDLSERHAALRTALEGAATRPGAANEALATAVRDLDRRLATIESRIAAVQAPVATAETRPAVALESRSDGPAPQSPASRVAVDSNAAARPTAAEAPAASRARKSFLAFELASESFRFDRPQRFEVVPALSRVGFDAKSTLHDFTGVTSRVEGFLEAQLSEPASRPSARIVATAAALDTGLADRNVAMRDEHLDVAHHPDIVFELGAFVPERIDAQAQAVTGAARGQMTIRGVARELTMPVKLTLDAAHRLAIEGSVPVKLTDFGVPVPSKLGLISMEDTVTVWVALRARWSGPARAAGSSTGN